MADGSLLPGIVGVLIHGHVGRPAEADEGIRARFLDEKSIGDHSKTEAAHAVHPMIASYLPALIFAPAMSRLHV